MQDSSYIIRPVSLRDRNQLILLYKYVARDRGGLARIENEITEEWIDKNLRNSLHNGLSFVAEETASKKIIGEVHTYKLEPVVFSHVFSELTIAIGPDKQGLGIGKALFTHLLNHIELQRKDILRVELIARESNVKAINFYKSIGFKEEGRFENRILNDSNSFEADIPMAWFNRNFSNIR